MSVLLAAEKRPYTAVALFLSAVTALVWVAGWNGWVALTIAAIIGARIGFAYVRALSAPYRTPDCRDGRHVPCAHCWCECHTTEEAAA